MAALPMHRYTLITPLVSDERGKSALVMRGWVPAAWRSDPALRAPAEHHGKVSQPSKQEEASVSGGV